MSPMAVVRAPQPPVVVVCVMNKEWVLSGGNYNWPQRGTGHITPADVPSASLCPTTKDAIREVKATSGLTWQQIASIFEVSPRTMHNWADGSGIDSVHESQLRKVLDVIECGGNHSPVLNRRFLVSVLPSGRTPLELLAAGEYASVKAAMVAYSSRSHQNLASGDMLSGRGQTLPVAVQMNALQDSASDTPLRGRKPLVRRVTRT